MALDVEKVIAAFRDPGVNEIMINPDGGAYVERLGSGMEALPVLLDTESVQAFLNAALGTEEVFGAKRPYADLSAHDGSRVHVISPPLTRGGMCVTIRKRPTRYLSLEEMVQAQSLTPNCAAFLKFCIENHKNMLIAGGTSSGKTTLLNALASLAGAKDRILVLEDTPEMVLPQRHVIYMKTRLRDPEGGADVTLKELLINSLRMRPDRIIVGECRSVEASDMLQAMNVGHEGVMCTLHASSAREALQRLETLTLLSGIDLPLKAVRQNIVQAIDLVVYMSKLSDGTRRVLQVAEITGMELDTITMTDLFKMDVRRSPGGVAFQLKAMGTVPRFFDQLRAQGGDPPNHFFQDA